MTAESHAGPSPVVDVPDTTSRRVWRETIGKVIAGFLLLFPVLQFGPALLLPRLAQPWHVLIPAVTMLGLALGCEALLFRHRPLEALRALGFGRPRGQAMTVALAMSGLMLLFFPALSLATGARLSLNGEWLPVLAGIILFNGLAEETLFRGYVFGHLRMRSSFLRAGSISLLLFAAVHLYLFAANPFVIALAATLVAVSAAFPMAYLFEHGNNTIWAPVILHVAAHAIRLVAIPEGVYMPALVAWLGMQILLPLLVFAFRRYLKA